MIDTTKLRWRKSSLSDANGACVEMAPLPGGATAVRNSNRIEDGILVFTRAEISAWIAGAKAGEFDDLA